MCVCVDGTLAFFGESPVTPLSRHKFVRFTLPCSTSISLRACVRMCVCECVRMSRVSECGGRRGSGDTHTPTHPHTPTHTQPLTSTPCSTCAWWVWLPRLARPPPLYLPIHFRAVSLCLAVRRFLCVRVCVCVCANVCVCLVCREKGFSFSELARRPAQLLGLEGGGGAAGGLPASRALRSTPIAHRDWWPTRSGEGRGRESRAKPELEGRKSKPKRGVYCVMPMAPLALLPARPRKFLGANNVQRCTGALVGALISWPCWVPWLAGGCLGWWVPSVGALVVLLVSGWVPWWVTWCVPWWVHWWCWWWVPWWVLSVGDFGGRGRGRSGCGRRGRGCRERGCCGRGCRGRGSLVGVPCWSFIP